MDKAGQRQRRATASAAYLRIALNKANVLPSLGRYDGRGQPIRSRADNDDIKTAFTHGQPRRYSRP